MRLAADSQALIERFFRAQLNDPQLKLPPIKIHSNLIASLFLRAQGISAMTLGRRIFVDAAYLKRDEQGRASAPGWLMAHEATHVLQFAREGWRTFLVAYLQDYCRALLKRKQIWRAQARSNA